MMGTCTLIAQAGNSVACGKREIVDVLVSCDRGIHPLALPEVTGCLTEVSEEGIYAT
jgi:hypothetical protein